MTSHLKKTLLSLSVILTFGSYALWSSTSQGEALAHTPENVAPSLPASEPTAQASPVAQETVPASRPIPTPAPAPKPLPTPTPQPTPVARGKFRDGSYTGSVADAYYGYIQVKAVISGGKLTDVVFLQYPNDRGTSIEINRQAMPYLREQAISIQGAEVDGVSGATDTAIAFQESLAAALSKAS